MWPLPLTKSPTPLDTTATICTFAKYGHEVVVKLLCEKGAKELLL